MERINTLELCTLMRSAESAMNTCAAYMRNHISEDKRPTTSATYILCMKEYAEAAVLYQKLYRLYFYSRSLEWKIEPTERGRY